MCHFCGKSRHIRPNCYKLQAAKRANKPKVPVPQAQDPIALIGKLVKALNLYSNLGVGNHSNVNTNSNARGASKKFWMQKTQTNWVFSDMVLVLHCFILCDHCSLVFVFFFLWSLGFALYYIHAFHSRCFFYLILKKKKRKERKEKGSTLLFLQYSLCFLKTRLVNLCSHDMFCCTLFSFESLFIALY